MSAGSPYDDFAPATLRFCEADLAGWIAQPANTWSNVGFLIVAAVIAAAARRDGDRAAALLAPLALVAGLTSAAFHASATLLGQLLDQGAMLLESGLFVVLGVARLRPRSSTPGLAGLYLAIAAGSIALLAAAPAAGIPLFVGHVFAFLSLELVVHRRRRRPTYCWLWAVAISFAASWTLWWLDRTGPLCDPDNHVFTAHAAWHLLGALQFYFWYRHYLDPPGTRR